MQERPTVEPQTRAEWRAWLEANHGAAPGVWVVFKRAATAGPGDPAYEALILEALCFGWVDSRPGAVDERRTKLYFAPRKPGSSWASSNKTRVEALAAAGLMAPAGLAAVARAKADGSWSRIDGSEAGIEPPDLHAALGRHPGAQTNWDAFPRGVRRAILQWVEQAKRPATRAARLEETASLAAQNIRANPWAPLEKRGRTTG